MPRVINFFETDGTTLLPTQERGGITLPLIENEMVYSDTGGSGTYQFAVRNTEANLKAINVQITSSQPPTDNEQGGTLLTEYSYNDPADEQWSSYLSTITIPEILPGKHINVRIRVTATESANPARHTGTIYYSYLWTSV